VRYVDALAPYGLVILVLAVMAGAWATSLGLI
jgi:hypothetical protein